MRAFRLSPNVHRATTLTGEGARLSGGRWHHNGMAVLYCSESRALAAMEYFVHVDPPVAPPELVLVAVEIPDRLVRSVDVATLPTNWKSYPAPDALKDIGSAWIRKRTSAGLLVPSALIPEERNVLLNVDHFEFGRIQFGPPSRFHLAGRA
jgi:RES domain-containing protein